MPSRIASVAVAFLAVVHLLSAPVAAQEPVRVGILGIDNFGSVAYTEFLNRPHPDETFRGVRVVAAYPVGSADYPESEELGNRWKEQLTNLYQNPQKPEDAVPPIEFVSSLDDLLQRVDGVMIFSLDGRLHRSQAEVVLRARKRLFISRPLASSVEDAVAILQLAKETGTPCWSSSQHRFSDGFRGMKNHPEVGQVIGCDVYGGWSPTAPEADRFTRPLHSLETLQTIMGQGVASVTCLSTPTTESITAVWKDGRIGTYRGIKTGAVKWSATVFGDQGVSTAGIYGHGIPMNGIVPTNDKYVGYEGLAIELAKFFKGGAPPVTPAETLEIFAMMQAAEDSAKQGGIPVTLPTLWPAK